MFDRLAGDFWRKFRDSCPDLTGQLSELTE